MHRTLAILLVVSWGAASGCDERPTTTDSRSGGSERSDPRARTSTSTAAAAGLLSEQTSSPGGTTAASVPSPMPIDQFWAIVHAAKAQGGGTQAGMAAALERALVRLSVHDIGAFCVRFDDLQDSAYRWDVWAAAYIMNGGCSDDSFMDFRKWLIASGRQVYEAALSDPDSLASLPDALTAEGVTFEELFGIVEDAYERVSGGQERPRNKRVAEEPAGEDFDFDDEDEMRRRFPKLAAKYLGPG